MVVTASFSRELDPKRARYWLGIALAKATGDLGRDHGRNPPMPIKLIRAEVKDISRVSAAIQVKRKRKRVADATETLRREGGEA